jgi:hypothetical protein
MSEIAIKETSQPEASRHKTITIGTTDINTGYSLQETIKIIKTIQKINVGKIPVTVYANQPDKNFKIPLRFQNSSISSYLRESATIFVDKLKESGIRLIHPKSGKNRTEINPIGFYAAFSKINTKDGVKITGIDIATKQTISEMESEIKKATGSNISTGWIFK